MGHHKIIAASKTQSCEKIRQVFSEGQKHFAENYIQEALEKIDQLKDLKIVWHFIGKLQKNKIKYLKNNFAYIHSIESVDQMQVLNKKCEELNYVQKIFLQVNLAQEETKSGWSESNLKQLWPEIKKFGHLQIVGLMTMPPLENHPEENRKYFRQLKALGDALELVEFSMGTSQDYKIALEEGSTWVRLGTALFGERVKK